MQRAVNQVLALALTEAVASVFTGKPLKIVMKETCAQLLVTQMRALGAGSAQSSEGGEAQETKEKEQNEQKEPKPENLMQEVLILGRNRVVIEKVDQVLKAQGVRSISVFYGAGHNTDLERRLTERGFVAVQDQWFPAWTMRSKARSWRLWRDRDRENDETPAPAPEPGQPVPR
jgi:hypothetical protein